MKNALLIFIGIAIIQSTSQYSLQGNWILELDESSQEINHGRQIIFDFQKKIENENIINHLTIYACNVMQFVYKIDQKDIAFQFRAELGNTKNCDTNETSDLRRKLQKIFYHVIITENLFLLTPDGQPLVKLIKLKENDERKDFSGEWNAFQVAKQHSTVIFTANGTQLELCDGKGLIGYEKKSKGQVKFSMLKTKKCAYHEFFTAVFRSRYYSQKKDEICFYNQKYDLIMKWKYIGPYKSDILLPSQTIYQEKEEQVLENKDEKKSILSDFSKSDEYIKMEKILTKWFPIESSFQQYFLILMNTRLVLYGGCNVYYSFFVADTSTPGQVELKSYSVSRSDRQCGNEDKIIIEKFSSIAYLEPLYNDNKILLNFLDSSYKTLFTASPIK